MKPSRLILDAQAFGDQIRCGLHEDGATARFVEAAGLPPAGLDELSADILRTLDRANEAGHLAAFLAANLLKTGRLLYDQLLPDSLKKTLRQSPPRELVLLMDESLAHLPWELLHDGGEFLGLKFELARQIRVSRPVRHLPPRSSRARPRLLILADPRGDLKAARVEAMVIGDVIDRGRQPVHLASKVREVTTTYLRKNIRDYDILHYAGHAESGDDPARSGWLLKDGRLTAEDILRMGGGSGFPRMVFSNACQSAHAGPRAIDLSAQERCFSLAAAFLRCGTGGFLGALWKIPDEAAMFFAREFYRQLLRRKSLGAAVRAARLYLIRSFGRDNIVWASYILYADPAAILFPRRPLARPAARRK